MTGAILYLSAVVILALNAILFLVAGFEPGYPPIQRTLASMIVLFDVALALSSLLWAVWFFRRGSRGLGFVFVANLLIYGGAFVIRSRNLMIPPWVFAVADLYWLQLYLITLMAQWRSLRVSSMTLKPPPVPEREAV